MTTVFGGPICPTCSRPGCLDHLTVEQDYPASAWDISNDYAPTTGARGIDRIAGSTSSSGESPEARRGTRGSTPRRLHQLHDGAASAPTRAVLKEYPSAVASGRLANGPRRCEDDATDCDCAGKEYRV